MQSLCTRFVWQIHFRKGNWQRDSGRTNLLFRSTSAFGFAIACRAVPLHQILEVEINIRTPDLWVEMWVIRIPFPVQSFLTKFGMYRFSSGLDYGFVFVWKRMRVSYEFQVATVILGARRDGRAINMKRETSYHLAFWLQSEFRL